MPLPAKVEKVPSQASKRRPLFFGLTILGTILVFVIIAEIVYFFYSGYYRTSTPEEMEVSQAGVNQGRRVIEGEVIEIEGTTFTLEKGEERNSLDIDGKVNYCGQDRGKYECTVNESSTIKLGQYLEADWLQARGGGEEIDGYWTIFVWD